MKKDGSLDRFATADNLQHSASHAAFIGGDKPLEMSRSKLEFESTGHEKNLTARRKRLVESGATSSLEFNSIGGNYQVPVRDYRERAIIGTGAVKFGVFGNKVPANGYIDKVVKRAKSSVDPRKYSSHDDWKKQALD